LLVENPKSLIYGFAFFLYFFVNDAEFTQQILPVDRVLPFV
jgi:hypothetical protein